MVTLEDWSSNKEWQEAYERFIRSEAGVAFRQVLLSMFFDEMPESINPNAIEVEALTSGVYKGYRRCYKNMERLQTKNLKKAESPIIEFTKSGLPLRPDVKKRVDEKMPKKRDKL